MDVEASLGELLEGKESNVDLRQSLGQMVLMVVNSKGGLGDVGLVEGWGIAIFIVLSVPNCWLKCMLLDPYNQTDHPDCKSRPDSGLAAITELDPGYITGPLSSVWREWVDWCVEFGIEADAIIAAPYDWRLSGPMLEERDLYFYRLKLTFEVARKRRGGPCLVFAHSLGNNVFRYFLEWLKLEIAPRVYQKWLDDHIDTYFAVGAPFLGAVESVKATLSGLTFGLPISELTFFVV
ncbi:hypothetical protein L7F22_053425 [Adiantum nelumboides]|nr:hypothetical protein [Adiantum nelumboides]